jgi:hypothetical protein
MLDCCAQDRVGVLCFVLSPRPFHRLDQLIRKWLEQLRFVHRLGEQVRCQGF